MPTLPPQSCDDHLAFNFLENYKFHLNFINFFMLKTIGMMGTSKKDNFGNSFRDTAGHDAKERHPLLSALAKKREGAKTSGEKQPTRRCIS